MAILEKPQPKKVFDFFEQLSAIPRGSYNTKAVSDYLAGFAQQRGLEYHQDELNNVIIIKEATAGYEDAEAVIIQGHMDMVCQKAPDCTKDMEQEGLDLAIGDDCIYAVGTTLGADDGIAVAMALAVLDSDELVHPRVEAVFTVDEETGMEGATGLDMSPLRGTRLLNIDSEEEGIFTVGCAGGIRVECNFAVERENLKAQLTEIEISGLLGGHSGVEIHKGRANPNILMGRLLYAMGLEQDIRLVNICGGDKDNAIPTASKAVVAVENAEKAAALCALMDSIFKFEYAGCDEGVTVSIRILDNYIYAPMTKESSRTILDFLCCAPNGVVSMSAQMSGLVQTSLNQGVLESDEKEVRIRFSVRSSIDSQKRMLINRLRCLTDRLGGRFSTSGDYPGWAYRKDSPLRDLLTEVYKEQYGKEPVIKAIHAGLECGLFIDKRPQLDCVSLGPDIAEIHTFREKLYISSTQRTWELLKETLKRMK